MSEPLALCVEWLDAESEEDRYLRCVAIPGVEPGLGITAEGRVIWEVPSPDACELSVSADGRLLLWRPRGAAPVMVRRAGRFLEAPEEKPVILIDQDQLDIGERRYRLHVHGPTPAVHAPSPLRARAAGRVATLAAAVALGGVALGCDEQSRTPDDIEVRDAPPSVESVPEGTAEAAAATTASATASSTTEPDASASAAVTTAKPRTPPPIEVRPSPPKMAPPEERPPKK